VDEVLPLQEGRSGPAVTDIRTRLEALGIFTFEDEPGIFGPATRVAVEAFQHRRGLRVDGICGPQTWNTLVEAGFRIGDRTLSRRSPMLRGDDVAEVQQRLGALGFDSGRVDGIFGDLTAGAIAEFQRNSGLDADGIVGPTTLEELLRVRAHHTQNELVSTVKAREQLRQAAPTLAGRHVAVGQPGGLGPAVAALRRVLVPAGARVTSLQHPDGSAQARQANAAGADVYLGLRLDPDALGCSTSFFSGYRNESPGGRRLAELVQETVPKSLGIPNGGVHGMSTPILRETRMPAVIVELGPASVLVERAPSLAHWLTSALEAWAGSAWE